MTAVLFEHFHGEVTRVPVDATAVPPEAGYNFLVTSVWTDPAASDGNVAWTKEIFSALEPFFVARRYLSYFSEDDVARTRYEAAYGKNYERLAELKNEVRPENMFHLNTDVSAGLATA